MSKEEVILLYLKDPRELIDETRDTDIEKSAEMRELFCSFPVNFAYCYAMSVDKGPHPMTRTACCKNPSYAYWYASDVDGKPTKETRKAAHRSKRAKASYDMWEDYFKDGIHYEEPLLETAELIHSSREGLE